MVASRVERRLALWAPVAIAILLRSYGITSSYPGLELQEAYPRTALLAVVRGDWSPPLLVHGSGVFDLLRLLTTAWYAIGRTFSLYRDRVDLLAAYVRHPEHFIIAGRVVVASLGVAAVYVVGRIGRDRFGPAAGFIAALMLAVSTIHVRQSFNIWPDGPAATAAIASVATSLWALRRPQLRTFVAAGASAGLAIATKHSMAPIALAVAAGVCLQRGATIAIVGRGLAVALLAIVATFVILSPYAVILFGELRSSLALQLGAAFAPGTTGKSSFATLIPVTIGWIPCGLAVVGLWAAIRRDARTAAVMAAFPLAYSTALAFGGGLLYTRYFAALAPFVALFAGNGIVSIATQLAPRRGTRLALLLAVAVIGVSAPDTVAYVRLRAHEDTRHLAGRWILANVPEGTALTFPDTLGHASPILPPNPSTIARMYPAFARELETRSIAERSYPLQYLATGGLPRPTLPRAGIVVTATLPVELPGLTAPEVLARLREAGARPLATFESVSTPLPLGVIYDPLDADYLPLTGADRLERPGPNITVWRLAP